MKEELIRIVVDYRKTLQKMVEDGNYDFVSNEFRPSHSIDSFANSFNIEGKKDEVNLEAEIIQFDFPIETSEVFIMLKQKKLKPVRLPELLAIGSQYPDLQRDFPIISLGSMLKRLLGDTIVPCLMVFDDMRALMPMWIIKWPKEVAFAAISA